MSFGIEVYLVGTTTMFARHKYAGYVIRDGALLLDLDDSDEKYNCVVYPLSQFYFKSLREV